MINKQDVRSKVYEPELIERDSVLELEKVNDSLQEKKGQ